MSFPFTLQFATYAFPNQTFEPDGHALKISLPMASLQRKNGGIIMDGFLTVKAFRINGKVYSNNIDVLHETLNILQKSLHNNGQAGNFLYRSDRQTLCRLGPDGVNVIYEKGLYQFVANVNAQFVTERPFAQSPTVRTESGSLTAAAPSFAEVLLNAGHYPSNPIITFIAGANNFSNNLVVLNNANSLTFSFTGPLLAGQTLVVDCDAGCVLLHVGAAMVDAMSYIAGDLFLQLEEGNNTLVFTGASLSYTARWSDRWYI